ncbi:conserved hypothetical protein [Pseudarthrobacter chlorophenolicus A6]|uniref:Uncharacterized protein n=1 Tax=Pseudarthrobacter chlorophenolicus (strain ATCC 700700 / DSM 12829 / CIP 107037 / JCM 12360 / KCTC 9906 / NCIMB 13794 / A6) TaxID=452863 RepID=B8HC16_PSECP|nr:DUF6707 family protein [Pseudarthrobacter chlorophenolicus]ACL38726.1 conserved hypothetical protein [Pseudarthrobacter chlorophenolicus A6]SDQ42883.1 hypothetical protein SAMN04489738_0798 [Pseudarthrobacter chlorophenolicus]
MTETPARQYREQQAGSLTTGSHILLPGGERTAEIHQLEMQRDDFGVPALVLASLTGGGTLRIAAGSTVTLVDAAHDAVTRLPRAAAPDGTAPGPDASALGTPPEATHSAGAEAGTEPGLEQPGGEPAGSGSVPAVVVPPLPAAPPAANGPSDEELALIPTPDGTPESVVEAAAEAHPDAVGVLLLTDRLSKGVNFKSGSCLKDLTDLAHELFVALKDAEGALSIADLLTVLPYDGNPGRWASVEASLALASYICRQDGLDERAAVYEKLIRTPESQETDPFKARMAAKVRQRSLNEPNLYDKEIFRSIDNSNHDAEREWRLLRLESLLFLRAHGGSETIGMSELERRIGNELEAVRA